MEKFFLELINNPFAIKNYVKIIEEYSKNNKIKEAEFFKKINETIIDRKEKPESE